MTETLSECGIDAVIVAVPARDESELLDACLSSIRAAFDHVGLSAANGRIAVAADSCSDDTLQIAERHGAADPRVVAVAGTWGSPGLARSAATEAGLQGIGAALERAWVITTDADSEVPSDWLVAHLNLAAQGWMAVAGIVRLAPDEHPAVLARFTNIYEVPAHGPHSHVHGANLGLRGDAYLAVDGWAPVALAEDHATWRRLQMAGLPIVASTSSWVWTSGRTVGRADGGFADTLSSLIA